MTPAEIDFMLCCLTWQVFCGLWIMHLAKYFSLQEGWKYMKILKQAKEMWGSVTVRCFKPQFILERFENVVHFLMLHVTIQCL